MLLETKKLWTKQDQHVGDRLALFEAVSNAIDITNALYPGFFVDVAASFVFPEVVYVDMDRRASNFFNDVEGVNELVVSNQTTPQERSIRFISGDYTESLDLVDESFDLLVSLYAGFVSEFCTRYLKIGGRLLVNPSHGDAAMASIDERYRLVAVVKSAGNKRYRVDSTDLDSYLVPKKLQPITVDYLHQHGRGIGYTKTAFAYIFERIS